MKKSKSKQTGAAAPVFELVAFVISFNFSCNF